ncbi:hypothetical protein CAF53_16835 [Sphingobium sp. LB126]|nr:hypothetical protein CAF53_16835 [Sphingobium sp. LB126]
MTWNWRPELRRHGDHPANAAEAVPFISAACPFLRHQTKITRFFEVSRLRNEEITKSTINRHTVATAICRAILLKKEARFGPEILCTSRTIGTQMSLSIAQIDIKPTIPSISNYEDWT